MRKQPDPKTKLACGEYDRRKANGQQQRGIAPIARLFGVSPRQLANYRANHLSRRVARKTSR